MNARRDFSRFPGSGDLPGDGTNPNDPAYNPVPSVLDCPNETGTWIANNAQLTELVSVGANEIISDYLTSFRDKYAKDKALRELLELAEKVEGEILTSERAA